MKQIEYFLDFYKSLNTPGMVLFWLIVVLFFFLFFSLIAVLLKNQELRKIIIKLRTEEKKNKDNIKENKASFNNNVRSLSIKKEDYDKIKEEDLKENSFLLNNEDIDDGINDEVIEEKEDIKDQKLEPIEVIEEVDEEVIKPKYEKEEIKEDSFVEEIKRQVDEEIDDGPIALTDFENSQEEDAIISYEELLRNAKMAETRENRYDIDIDDDNDFLKELKSFRSNL